MFLFRKKSTKTTFSCLKKHVNMNEESSRENDHTNRSILSQSPLSIDLGERISKLIDASFYKSTGQANAHADYTFLCTLEDVINVEFFSKKFAFENNFKK